jgi:hypothetical protein
VVVVSRGEKFLKAKGLDCTIKRTPIVTSKVSIKRSTRASRDLGVREGYWEGLILLDASLASGEVMTIGTDDYLVQSTNFDPASSATAFFAAKSNATLQHMRISEYAVGGNVVQAWVSMNANVKAFGEIVTYRLRQEDPGLLDQTRYIFQVPKSISAMELDRIVYNGDNYKVVSIDDVALKGIDRLQLGFDERPD